MRTRWRWHSATERRISQRSPTRYDEREIPISAPPQPNSVYTSDVQAVNRVPVGTLWAAAGLLALAVVAILGQALARETLARGDDFPTLRALGHVPRRPHRGLDGQGTADRRGRHGRRRRRRGAGLAADAARTGPHRRARPRLRHGLARARDRRRGQPSADLGGERAAGAPGGCVGRTRPGSAGATFDRRRSPASLPVRACRRR